MFTKLWQKFAEAKPKHDFESVAHDLEERAYRLSTQNNPSNLGNDQIVLSVAKLVRALGTAERSASNTTRFVIFLTILNIAFTLYYAKLQVNLTQIQTVPEKLNQEIGKRRIQEFCNSNPTAEESRWYLGDGTGKSISCNEFLKTNKL